LEESSIKTVICSTPSPLERAGVRLAFCLSLILFSCAKKNTPKPEPTTNNTYASDNLTDTKWRLYQYQLSSSTVPNTANDTLIFTSDKNYTYNGQAFTYLLEKSEYYNNCRLTLNNTPFGSMNGYPTLDFKTYGTINGVPFTQLTVGSPQTYNFWLQKF